MKQTRNLFHQTFSLAGVLLLLLSPAASAQDRQLLRPAVIDQVGGLTWEPTVEYERATMIVSRPDGTTFQREFSVHAQLSFDLVDPDGQTLQDGAHQYRLLLFRTLRPGEWEARGRVYQIGHDLEVVVESTNGSFAIKNGILAGGEAVGEKEPRPRLKRIPAGGEVVGEIEPRPMNLSDSDSGPQRDQVILDDLIVDGSACIGFDCVNGESFGFDTLRLKENNLRIRAQDTSSTASFPSNDWQITFNDSSNGGANKFSIDDIDGGRTPFTLEAGAPSHSLYVDDGGRLGLGTNTPVVDVHVKSGNTPTLRLEQDGSSGFTPQIWDVAGNEANFFIRDATNGSTLPFRIFPGAPSNALNIAASGNVGFGVTAPDDTDDLAERFIEVKHTSGDVRVVLDRGNGAERFGEVLFQENNTNRWSFGNDNSQFYVFNYTTGANNLVIDEATGNVGLSRAAAANRLEVEGDASKTVAGNWLANSDRRIKKNVATVKDALETLDKVRLVSFEYTDEYRRAHAGIGARRYLNVIAQEFQEVFPDEVRRGGDTLPDGSEILQVDSYPLTIYAAAAVQELHAKMKEKDAQIALLRAEKDAEIACEREEIAKLHLENASFRARLERLEALIATQGHQTSSQVSASPSTQAP